MTSVDILLSLIRIAFDKAQPSSLSDDISWEEVLALADAQGMAAIAADGIAKAKIVLPQDTRREFAVRVLMHEQVYQQHELWMSKLAKVYRKGGFRMMLLKGWGMSLNYPVPCHRPSGDLDIWLFGQWKEADKFLALRNIKVDNRHHHHSVFSFGELTVENHYDFINTHAHRSSKYFEKKLKELANTEYEQKEVYDVEIYLPGADFNMLFLLRHSANHFVGKEMTIRQLLDWALFVERHHHEINWKTCLDFLNEQGLYRYFNILSLICVEKFGFCKDIFHCELVQDVLMERVFADILKPEFSDSKHHKALGIIAMKTRRWWCNRWKHRLCYPDSLLSGFIFGVWAKVLKPSHFLH